MIIGQIGRSLAVATLLAGLDGSLVVAQTLRVGDPLDDYLRVLQIAGDADVGSQAVRPGVKGDPRRVVGIGPHPWADYLDARFGASDPDALLVLSAPEVRAFANSRFPVGRNDGVVWQGRGLTTALDLGATLRFRALTVELRPTALFTQNASHELAPVLVAGMPIYGYPWRKIDLPQRFGPDADWTLDPGQSEARVDVWNFSFGFGTRNLSWGPALENPILMSNNAPGFPHAFVGTDGALPIGIGTVELRWIWGRLQQSDWFDPTAETGRFITGISAAYSPEFADGLSLGLARVLYMLVQDGGVQLGDYLGVLSGFRKKSLVTPQNPLGDDPYDQLISVFGRWVLRESGFEVYGEWARTDHSWDLRDFLLEPEHSQAYVLGFQKSFARPENERLAMRAELAHLEAGSTYALRGYPRGTYYEHTIVTQGYTQRGQVIGAGIGPGGNSQLIGADLYAPWGRAGGSLERQVHDNDAYYAWAEDTGETYCCHDVSFHFAGRALFFLGDFDVGGGFVATREFNRYFYGLDLWNLNLSLTARWHAQ